MLYDLNLCNKILVHDKSNQWRLSQGRLVDINVLLQDMWDKIFNEKNNKLETRGKT